jgi:3-oxoacyl-[acyl-carrier-protein] synthase I
MTEKNRVFITGRGALSCTGMTPHAMWDALLSGHSALSEIKHADLSNWKYRLGGEISDYQPSKLLPDRKLLKVLSKQDVLGLNAASQAIADSGLIAYRDCLEDKLAFNEETGVYVASPGNKYFQQYDFLPLMAKSKSEMPEFAEHLFSEVHPMWLLRILPNNVLAYTSMLYGFRGENHNIVNHVCSGMQAILEAYYAIQRGLASRAVVVGYDIGIEPQALFYYGRLGILSDESLRPFDQNHSGTIMAEGAAALILESEESVRARGKKPYAEIKAGSVSTEGGHLFSLDPSGRPLETLLRRTVEPFSTSEIGMVVAHGNANPCSDMTEAYAIHTVLGDTPVSAFKWSMGHTLCASGLMDTVLSLDCLSQRKVPGIATLNRKANSCEMLNVSHETRAMEQHTDILLINRGFAGMNATLLLSDCDSV